MRIQNLLKLKHRFREIISTDRTPGSLHWLIDSEKKYGGYTSGVPRNHVSPNDDRTTEELQTGGMIGGDRMPSSHCGYGLYYAKYLKPFVLANQKVTLVETGILRGIGLATWCDLFPDGRVIGLDIDLGHITSNTPILEKLGAFSQNSPELHEFDQLVDNREMLGRILDQDKVDIAIDDGLHSVDSIIKTMRSLQPHLANDFVYFVEDNAQAHKSIRSEFPEFQVQNYGMLSIIRPNNT